MPKSITRFAVAALAGLGACSDEPAPSNHRTTLIADLPDAHLGIDYVQPTADPRRVTVELRYGSFAPVLLDGNHWYCPIVDDSIEARVADLTLDLVDAGGSYSLADSPHCRPPRFELELPGGAAPATTAISVRDRSGELAFDLGDVQVPRTFAAPGHADWTFAPGEPVALTVTPPVRSPSTSVTLVASWDAHDLASDTQGGLHVTVPATPGTGTLSLVLEVDARCGDACELVTTYEAKTRATIAP